MSPSSKSFRRKIKHFRNSDIVGCLFKKIPIIFFFLKRVQKNLEVCFIQFEFSKTQKD